MLFCHHEKVYAEDNKDNSFVTVFCNKTPLGIRKGYFFAFEEEAIFLIMIANKEKDGTWAVTPDEETEEDVNGKKNYHWKINR